MQNAMMEEEALGIGVFELELIRKAFRECGGVCDEDEAVCFLTVKQTFHNLLFHSRN